MGILSFILKILFMVFILYTAIFVFQWICSFCIAVYRMSQHKIRKKVVREIFPDELAKQHSVSVIIPAYNEEACICQTIDSLLKEGYPNLEILVINDGSKDHTEEVVAKTYNMEEKQPVYKERIPTSKVVHYYEKIIDGTTLKLVGKVNSGKSDALNCGLNLCKSPHCIILDADTKVEKDSIRNLRCQFVADNKMIVCAGVVGNAMYGNRSYTHLSIMQKTLVLFQQLEYFRTFYMQRVLFDKMNANVVVSGAFAMFRTELLREVGGYKTHTIGEDMEITMRLHAFCQSQKIRYHIGYIPEAKCNTQVPFTYRDYYNQRRRWHIGMIQSLKEHKYMIGNAYYGGAGIISGSFILLYELWAPFIEIVGVIVLILSAITDVLNVDFVIKGTLVYVLLTSLTQMIIIRALNLYRIENIRGLHRLKLFVVSLLEVFLFHPFNIVIKLIAFFKAGRYSKEWKHIERENEKSI